MDKTDPMGLQEDNVQPVTHPAAGAGGQEADRRLEDIERAQQPNIQGELTARSIEQAAKARPGTVYREKEVIVEREVDVVMDRNNRSAKGPDGQPARGSTDATITAAQKSAGEYTLNLRIDSQIAKIGTAKERDAARAIERGNQQKFSDWYHSPAVGTRAFFYAVQGGLSRLQTGMRNDLQNQITTMKLGDIGGYNNIYRRMGRPDEE